jgi:cell division septum initiation protein DivIVA
MDTEPTATNGVLVTPTGSVRGYSSTAVDEYLAAAERERERLNAALAEAKERRAKARASIGLHRVMLSMLLEAQEELQARRAEADAEAAAALQAAEVEADAIVRAARAEVDGVRAPAAPPPLLTEATDPPGSAAPRVIDLPREHRRDMEPDRESAHGGPTDGMQPIASASQFQPVFAASASNDVSGDDYFRYLRGALHDEQPLGPRHD